MKIITLEQITSILPSLDLLPAIEAGFVAYCEGNAIVPPVGELLFTDPPGDVHIKYGYLLGDAYYVIKIASGFYANSELNLPSSNGLMLLFQQQTGQLASILLDEGYLTDMRTAVAGAIAAKYLAPQHVHRIGIMGTGIQARLQLRALRPLTTCREVLVWGRGPEQVERYQREMESEGWQISTTLDRHQLVANCNLLVTTTAATVPIVSSEDVQPGTHITAVGADTASKQELDPHVFRIADLVVADSIAQCRERGDSAHALRAGLLEESRLVELGQIIAGHTPGRTANSQITIADLTGVAVQDIQIATAVFEAFVRPHTKGDRQDQRG